MAALQEQRVALGTQYEVPEVSFSILQEDSITPHQTDSVLYQWSNRIQVHFQVYQWSNSIQVHFQVYDIILTSFL